MKGSILRDNFKLIINVGYVIKGILEMCKEKKIIIAISHDKDIIDYFDEVVEL